MIDGINSSKNFSRVVADFSLFDDVIIEDNDKSSERGQEGDYITPDDSFLD